MQREECKGADGAAALTVVNQVILWDTVVHDTGTRGGTSAGNKARLQRTLPRQPQAQQSHVDADNQMQARCSPGSEAVSTVLEREIVAHALAQKKSRRGGGAV